MNIIKIPSKLIRRYISKATRKHYQKQYKARLKKTDYTIFASNCIGGIITNRLGQPFNSPTVNLWILQKEFIRFLQNPRYYLEQDLHFIESEYKYPVAELGDIKVNFTHYHSAEEAEEAWKRRIDRIHWDNIYAVLYEDEVTREDLLLLKDLDYKGLVVLTNSKENLDLPFMQYIEKDTHGRENDYVYLDTDFTGKMTFEKQWDFVSWINEANGGSDSKL